MHPASGVKIVSEDLTPLQDINYRCALMKLFLPKGRDTNVLGLKFAPQDKRYATSPTACVTAAARLRPDLRGPKCASPGTELTGICTL
jgi:hypothetical protein